MNRMATTVVFGLILLVSIGSISAQNARVVPVLSEDTSINPHDFTNEFYAMHGINPKAIIGRRTGTDGLSVFSFSSNPFHTNVRVTGTIPAYDQNGDMVFWYPLGDLQNSGFTEDKIGANAREIADHFPIYVFPNTKMIFYGTFANNRQAALMDNSFSMTNGEDINPLGIRALFVVNYTEKAFTKEGFEMMFYFGQKNGVSADDTPIIRTMEDMQILLKNEMIEMAPMKAAGVPYTISTPIYDPTNRVIANDAFLWYVTKDEKPLPAEEMFLRQFECLKQTGFWCEK